jgi:RNA polymerase sigma-70 factor (ECF subfamily)
MPCRHSRKYLRFAAGEIAKRVEGQGQISTTPPIRWRESRVFSGCSMVAINSFSTCPAASRVTTDRAARATASRKEALHDVTLVQRFNTGDESAFVEIIARYREKMLSIAFAQLRNHADAEEITQDAFIRAHRGLATFRGDSSLATWLHRIAVNLARNRYWYFFRRRRHLTISLDCPLHPERPGTFSDVVATTDADPARQAAVDEFVGMVAVCMKKLNPSHREILTMRNQFDISYAEIATTLGIGEGTVKSRIARARGNLRELMAEAYPEFSPEAPTSDWLDPVRGAAA